jgi:hypothetical protein
MKRERIKAAVDAGAAGYLASSVEQTEGVIVHAVRTDATPENESALQCWATVRAEHMRHQFDRGPHAVGNDVIAKIAVKQSRGNITLRRRLKRPPAA